MVISMRIFVVNSRKINAVISVVSVAALALATVGMLVSAKENRILPIYNVENSNKQIAVTFDAAWDDSNVDELISIMDEYGVKSTVFAVGEWAEKYPDAVKKLSDAGHEIANHSDKHRHIKSMSKDEFIADVKACNERLTAITGKTVTLYRGAYGEYNNMSVSAVESLGMYYIQWDCDSLDWKPDYTVDMIVSSALKKAKPGSIMLLHIGAKLTAEALPRILTELKNEGYRFVTVSELIYKDNYKIDSSGKQIRCAPGKSD